MTDRIIIKEQDTVIRIVGPPASSASLVSGSVPTKDDKDLVPLSTSGDGSPTGLTITTNPTGAAPYVGMSANGVEYTVGDGVKTTDAYFSADGGTTAKVFGAILAGDELIWNAVIAGFDLLNSRDSINFDYDI